MSLDDASVFIGVQCARALYVDNLYSVIKRHPSPEIELLLGIGFQR